MSMVSELPSSPKEIFLLLNSRYLSDSPIVLFFLLKVTIFKSAFGPKKLILVKCFCIGFIPDQHYNKSHHHTSQMRKVCHIISIPGVKTAKEIDGSKYGYHILGFDWKRKGKDKKFSVGE